MPISANNPKSASRANFEDSFGFFGAPTPITTTAATSAPSGQVFTCFQVWTNNSTIASITINGVVITAFSSVQLPSGFTVYGQISSITLGSSSSGMAYVGSPINDIGN